MVAFNLLVLEASLLSSKELLNLFCSALSSKTPLFDLLLVLLGGGNCSPVRLLMVLRILSENWDTGLLLEAVDRSSKESF